MTDQAELDKIILQLLGKDDHIGKKSSIVIYDNDDIVKMDLSDLALTSLPDGIFDNFTQLRELDLSYNAFSVLPETIFRELTDLRRLDLSFTLDPTEFSADDPVSLPDNLLNSQSKLQFLNLSGNQLEVLPDVFFSKLYNLEVLDLSYNLLAILPSSIGTLVNLEELYLDGNFLPIEFGTEYTEYQELQEFLTPFQQEWMATHETILSEENEKQKDVVEDELKRAFSALETLFDD